METTLKTAPVRTGDSRGNALSVNNNVPGTGASSSIGISELSTSAWSHSQRHRSGRFQAIPQSSPARHTKWPFVSFGT